MLSSNAWHKFHIYRHQIRCLGVCIALLLSIQAVGQNRKPPNLPNYDDKLVHFGFYVAPHYTIYKVRYSRFFQRNADTILAARPKGSPGFSTGFLVALRINEDWNLRFLPGVSFYERAVWYQFKNAPQDRQVIESTFVELPLNVKYKSERRGNVRMYLTAGVKTGFEVGAKRKERSDRQLRTNNRDFALEYGFGLELFYPLFKFAPEVRFSHGVNNMLEPDNNIYANTISRMYTHTVTFYFNFE